MEKTVSLLWIAYEWSRLKEQQLAEKADLRRPSFVEVAPFEALKLHLFCRDGILPVDLEDIICAREISCSVPSQSIILMVLS